MFRAGLKIPRQVGKQSIDNGKELTELPTITEGYQIVELPRMFQRYNADIRDSLRRTLVAPELPVYDMLRYCMGWVDVEGRPCVATEGKGLRPTLCLFACEATGGSNARRHATRKYVAR